MYLYIYLYLLVYMDLIIIIQTLMCSKPRTSYRLHLFNVICTYAQMAMVLGHLCHCLTSGVIWILARGSLPQEANVQIHSTQPTLLVLTGFG